MIYLWILMMIYTIAIAVKEGWYDYWKQNTNIKNRNRHSDLWHIYSAIIFVIGFLTIMLSAFSVNYVSNIIIFKLCLSLIFIRFSLFDNFRNLSQRLPIEYVGSSDPYSRFIKKIPVGVRLLLRGVSLIISYFIITL